MASVKRSRADAIGVDRVGANALGAVVEGVLAHEEQSCRLGYAIRTQIRARIDRLLRGVEKEAAAEPLGSHHRNRGLSDVLVAPEVKLETAPEGVVGDGTDRPLPRRAGIGDDDVEAAEGRADVGDGAPDGGPVGDVAGDRDAADRVGHRLARSPVDIQHGDGGAVGGEGSRRGGADAGCTAGHHDHMAGKGRLHPLQLRLLRRPGLDLEQVAGGQGLEAADGLGGSDDGDVRLRKVGGDRGIFRRTAESEETDPGHQGDARRRVRHHLGATEPPIEAGKCPLVLGSVGGGGLRRGVGEGVETAGLGRWQDQGFRLDAQHMVRRRRSLAGVAFDLAPVDEPPDGASTPKGKDEAPAVVCRAGESANDRRHVDDPSGPPGQGAGGEDGAPPLLQAIFGHGHEVDHAVVGLAGRVAHREDAMAEQDEAFDLRLAFDRLAHRLGEGEARHGEGKDDGAAAVEAAAEGLAVRLVGQRQDRVGMGVVDEALRQEGVKEDLHRWVGRRRVEFLPIAGGDHRLVVQVLEVDQSAQGIEADRGQALGPQVRHVVAARLHMENVDRRAVGVGAARLH